MRLHCLVIALLAAACCANAATIEVKPTENAPLQAARDASRNIAADEPVTILVRGGMYVLRETLELGAADRAHWRAAEGEEVRIVGGPPISADAFKAVTDERVLARFDDAARKHVLRADLASVDGLKLDEYPTNFRGAPATAELFFNDQRMTVARWPNNGWATIEAFVDT